MKIKVTDIAILFIFTLFFTITPFAYAQLDVNAVGRVDVPTEYEPLAPLTQEKTVDTNDFAGYANTVFQLLISIAGVLAVVYIVVGGIEYMGSESMFSKEEGKKKISNAFFGLLLAISSYLILQTINPKLLELDIKPDPNMNRGTQESLSQVGSNNTLQTWEPEILEGIGGDEGFRINNPDLIDTGADTDFRIDNQNLIEDNSLQFEGLN